MLYDDRKIKQAGWRQEGSDLSTIKVIFCGQLYRGLYREVSEFNKDTGNLQKTYQCFWDSASLLEELKRQECQLHEDEEYWSFRSGANSKRVTLDTIDSFFESQSLPKSIMDTLIAENIVHSIQVGTVSGLKKSASTGQQYAETYAAWYDNTDGLKAIGFAKVIDPWQAYQQIDMWLGSQLAKDEDNMVKLSDKELIAKHGFDKVSFRNTHHVGKPRGQK